MQRREFVSQLLRRTAAVAAGCGACGTAGCGTIFYSERCHEPHSHQIDWKIAALDGLGMLFFFVPGIVAFAVDFATGAIYLPLDEAYPPYGAPHGYGNPPPHPAQPPAASQPLPPPPAEARLRPLPVPRGELRLGEIERLVGLHVGRRVSLDDNGARLSELATIERFDAHARRHAENRDFGHEVRSYFARRLTV